MGKTVKWHNYPVTKKDALELFCEISNGQKVHIEVIQNETDKNKKKGLPFDPRQTIYQTLAEINAHRALWGQPPYTPPEELGNQEKFEIALGSIEKCIK